MMIFGMTKFDNLSDCLECFNLIANSLLDLLVQPKKLRIQQQDFLAIQSFLH